jgi:uncharacterized protein (TIGR02680 family)
VLNLYRYDYEEFHYEEGRLLLRGNNGSGKSRVLALQLPFLLDGEVSPARVEPDGDAAKRIEWNLLMGRHTDRTGYTWIEFGRRDEDGTTHFFTLGCGLHAVAGQTGLRNRWFFTTTLRIGRDVFLQNAQRTPLSQKQLEAALGATGRVYQKSEDYRRAVDTALFGLGARYGALIDLLIRLRRPQLTRTLDENELPNALSEALPTLSALIVEEVAESFRSLQAEKDAVRDYLSARDAVTTFLREYTSYVRIAIRRRATTLRTTHSAYENAGRAVKDATARLETAAATLASLVTEHTELKTHLAGAETAERTLANRPEMRTATEIQAAGEAASAAEIALTETRKDEQSAATAFDLAQSRERIAEEKSAEVQQRCDASLRSAAASASTADLDTTHRAHLPEDLAPGSSSAAEAALNKAVAQRTQGIALLQGLEVKLHAAATQLAAAKEALLRAEAAATEAREAEHTARDTLAAEGASLLVSYTEWRAATVHLQPAEPSSFTEVFDAWLEQREGTSPLRRAIEEAQQQTLARFTTRDNTLAGEATELTASITDLTTQITDLENGSTQPPSPPVTRRADRTQRPGAPLWKVCDFHPHVSTADRAGLEAALEASGLLDAWLLPDGSLLDPTTEDTFLLTASSDAPLHSHLGGVLLPAIDPGDPSARLLSPSTVAGVLASIGYKTHPAHSSPAWISADGAWQLGPLSGHWSKQQADFIGESTRAAARRRQLETLFASRDQARAALGVNRLACGVLLRDRATATGEFAAAPSDEAVRRAGFMLEASAKAVTATFEIAGKATAGVTTARIACEQHQDTLHNAATDLKLSAWLGRLIALSDATRDYAQRLAALWPTLRHAESELATLAAIHEQTATAETEFLTRTQRREHAAIKAESTRRHFETLQKTHGQTVSAILAEHALALAEVGRLKEALSLNEKSRIKQTAEHSTALENQKSADEKRSIQEALRHDAIGNLRRLAAQRLLADADPALRSHDLDHDLAESWSVARAVDIARDIETHLADVPADPAIWQQRQDQIHSHITDLRDRLTTHGHSPETHQVEDIVLVRCPFQSRSLTMTELHAALTAETEARDRILKEREREIIENHLLAEAAVELQKLIRAAELWRTSANEELHSRPTSTGVRFRFQWEADTETRFHEIRPILLRKGELWTPIERTAVATFLQGRIAAAQTDDESGSWRDHLSRALDYRRWHRFVIERQQEGQWRRLNKTTYGTGSGGEKALALTLPRFAAAAAHYRGAAPTAPRLVMLDEAFAGIDPTMRAQCLGVLTQFDLDVVMTSELEWGCYATVPALAIYHLTTLPTIDAVASTRWLWNGREKRQLDHPEPQDLPPTAPSDDLFPPPPLPA